MKLDSYEKELLLSVEKGEWKSISNLKAEIERYKNYAKNSGKKDKVVSFRLNTRDFVDLKAKALQEGMPYQTLLGSIIHKYVS